MGKGQSKGGFEEKNEFLRFSNKYDFETTDRRIGWKGESRYNAFSPENLGGNHFYPFIKYKVIK